MRVPPLPGGAIRWQPSREEWGVELLLITKVSKNGHNRPFSTCLLPQFQNESSYDPFQMKISLV